MNRSPARICAGPFGAPTRPQTPPAADSQLSTRHLGLRRPRPGRRSLPPLGLAPSSSPAANRPPRRRRRPTLRRQAAHRPGHEVARQRVLPRRWRTAREAHQQAHAAEYDLARQRHQGRARRQPADRPRRADDRPEGGRHRHRPGRLEGARARLQEGPGRRASSWSTSTTSSTTRCWPQSGAKFPFVGPDNRKGAKRSASTSPRSSRPATRSRSSKARPNAFNGDPAQARLRGRDEGRGHEDRELAVRLLGDGQGQPGRRGA